MAKEQMTVTLKKVYPVESKPSKFNPAEMTQSQGTYILWTDGREFKMYNNGPQWFTVQQEKQQVTVMGEWKQSSKAPYITCSYGQAASGAQGAPPAQGPPAAAPAPAQAPTPTPAPATTAPAPAPATAAPPIHNAAQPVAGYDEYSADPVRMGRGCSLKAFAAALAEIMPWELGAYLTAGVQFIDTGIWNPPAKTEHKELAQGELTGAGPVDEQPEQQPQNPGEGEWE